MHLRRCALVTIGAVVALLLLPPALNGQARPDSAAVAVYLDCQTAGCDSNFFRTEIPFVDWVLDREAADVHLLVTAVPAGGGGRQYTIAFLGRGRFPGDSVQLRYSSSGDATNDDLRRALSDRFKAGLMRYAVYTGALERVRITYAAPTAARTGPARPANDPWNFWIVTLGLNGNSNGEASNSFLYLNGHVTASRVTDRWKLAIGGLYTRNRSRFELPDREVVALRTNWGANGVAVKSLTAHWSTGVRFTSSSNSFQNQDLALTVGPGIEFNIFPYTESTRRSLTFQYLVTLNRLDWTQETIFGQLAETHPSHSAISTVQMVQPWGNVRLNVSLNQYLHDTGKYNLQVGGNWTWRIFRGFQLNGGGNYTRIRDQLFLPKGTLSDDQILTQQRQLATSYRYFTYFGISYRFGSVTNNVVNPRFGPDMVQGTFFF